MKRAALNGLLSPPTSKASIATGCSREATRVGLERRIGYGGLLEWSRVPRRVGEGMNGDPREGGCFCGRVRYRVTGEPVGSAVCHCVSCRRTSGAQSVAWLTFPHRKFSFVQGEPADYRSSDEVSRTFCQSCGTSLTYRH